MSEQKQITISSIVNCLNDGMSREEIAEHFGVTLSEMKEHFKHPKLKGLKKRKKPASVLVDDTEDLFDIENPQIEEDTDADIQEEEVQEDIAAEVASIHEKESEVPTASDWDN